jgi:hypothetical protein
MWRFPGQPAEQIHDRAQIAGATRPEAASGSEMAAFGFAIAADVSSAPVCRLACPSRGPVGLRKRLRGLQVTRDSPGASIPRLWSAHLGFRNSVSLSTQR